MKKYIKYLLALAVMVIMFMPLSARAEQSNGLTYEYDEDCDEIYITGYTGTAAQLDIPATIDGKKVTTIDDSVFENCNSLVDVTVSADLDYIGSNVFSGCSNLKSVIFTARMLGNMEYGAFSDCKSLEKVVLPERITSIDSEMFIACGNLKYVYIPDSVTNIVQGTFDDAQNVVIQCTKGSAAYKYAIRYGIQCSYSDGSKTDIAGEDTEADVYGISDVKYLIDEKVCLDGIGLTVDGKQLVKNKDYTISYKSDNNSEGKIIIKGIGNYCGVIVRHVNVSVECMYTTAEDGNLILSYYKADSANVVVPAQVGGRKVVGTDNHGVFDMREGIDAITSITLPDTIEFIGDDSFFMCDIKSITIPDSVKTIGDGAFRGAKLRSINIPKGVTSLGVDVFYNCSYLSKITVDSENPVYDSRNNCNAIIETATNTLIRGGAATVIPSEITAIASTAFGGCNTLKKITLPKGLKNIGMHAFLGCSQITAITIPAGVTHIGFGAFMDCSKLVSLKIPDGVTELNGRTFDGCIALKSITLSKNITRIKSQEFNNCKSLTQITLPSKLKEIWACAFWNCKSLTRINIPASVTDIREGLFFGCDNLVKVTVDENNKKYDSRNNCNAIIEKASSKLVAACNKTVIPGTVKIIGENAFYWQDKIKSVIIPASVVEIEDKAFGFCKQLEKVVIPYSVTKIESGAFEFQPKLTIYTRKYSAAYNVAVKNKLKYSLITTDLAAKSSKTVVTGITNKQYTGKKITQSGIVVKAYGKTLKAGVDYSITYKNNVKAGKAQVVITGKGGYKGAVVKTFGIVISKNKVYTVGCLKYRVTNAATNGSGTVTLTGSTLTKANVKFTILSVKSTVIIGGVRFKVTAIGANAFNGYTHLKNLVIADGIKVIGDKAFYGCKSLTTVKLGNSIKVAGSQVFTGIAAKPVVTVPAAKVPSYKTMFRKAGMPAKAVYKTK